MNELPQSPSLEEVARRFNEAGVPWAVFAGAAASAYGASRPPTDVDILVPVAERGRVMVLIPEAELVLYDKGSLVLSLPGFDVVAGLGLMDLDTQMAARLTRHEIDGVPVPVIPAEDNILLKAMWGRGPEEGKHDWEDVQAMMASLPTLDWDYLRWRAETFNRPEQVQAVLQWLERLWRQRDRAITHEAERRERDCGPH